EPGLFSHREHSGFGAFDVDLENGDLRIPRFTPDAHEIRRTHLRGLARERLAHGEGPFVSTLRIVVLDDQSCRTPPHPRASNFRAPPERPEVLTEHLEVALLRLDGDETRPRVAAQEVGRRVTRVRAAINDEARFVEIVEAAVRALHED